MEKRIAIVSILLEEGAETDKINALLHEFKGYIKGRMGLPEVNPGISVICVVIDAPGDIINSVTGKIGMIRGVKAKTLIK
ncbi:MAG: iron-only hydrogenase system regulator [Firmicutes bacterium]|nr:iron-only hydrogenase system regulator [Bacillota bacterium]MDY5531192.1 TM1266 family iron-only hydrogenase system putative regulator [Pumilibacteraceae bacterium]